MERRRTPEIEDELSRCSLGSITCPGSSGIISARFLCDLQSLKNQSTPYEIPQRYGHHTDDKNDFFLI
jgi:hypothetical protein